MLRHFSTSLLLLLVTIGSSTVSAQDALRISVYATAGDVLRYGNTEEGRQQVLQALKPLGVSRLFLEGRRGDEYAPPQTLAQVRDFFQKQGVECSGGIATVPGGSFGVRQNEPLGWLNWEAARTQQDVANFFTENAPVFDALIVDDFYCTADTSAASEQARGSRSWGEYRRDLMVSLIEPMIRQPTRTARSTTRLIIKFPQWYDRFHLFGYDPARMARPFEQVWVGTEVRDPLTRRMGFVQPTEGYINFSWLRAVAGDKVIGAWFDHIECSAQNFVDQAYQSVLAGARELTLFRLGDVMGNHPGDALLAGKLADLLALARHVAGKARLGIPYYKPPGSDPADNLYLMDYLTMLGVPILPQAAFPEGAPVAFFGAQAAADPDLMQKIRRQVGRGGTVMMTPALVRKLGIAAEELAGVEILAESQPAVVSELRGESGAALRLAKGLEIDAGLSCKAARSLWEAESADKRVPLLTARRQGDGAAFVLNMRTFSEQDFRDAGEWLLAPKPRGWTELPRPVLDTIRAQLLGPMRVRFEAPAGVGLYLFQGAQCLYNFHNEAVAIALDGRQVDLQANECLWLEK